MRRACFGHVAQERKDMFGDDSERRPGVFFSASTSASPRKRDVLSLYLLRIYAVDRSPNLQGSIAPKALYIGGCEFKTFDEFDVVLPKQFYGSASLYEVPVVGQKIGVLCEHAGQCRRVLFIECLCERVFKLLNIRLGLRYGTSRKHGNKGGCRYNRLDHFPLAETI